MAMNMKVAPPPKSCLGVAKCNSCNNNNNPLLLQVGGTINPDENNDEKGKMLTSASSSSSSSGRKASLITLEQLVNYESMHGHGHGDLTKLRKIISNRLSAQRCRNKKTLYIRDMEKKASDLQATISMLSPEIGRYKEIQRGLMVENALLIQHLHTFTRKSNLLKGEMEAMQVEVNRLRVVHEVQKEQKLKALLMEEYHLHAAQATAASTMENWIGE